MWINRAKYNELVDRLAECGQKLKDTERKLKPFYIQKTVDGKDREWVYYPGLSRPFPNEKELPFRDLLERWAKDMRFEEGCKGYLKYRDDD